MKAQCPEFDLQNPCKGGRRELTHATPLLYTQKNKWFFLKFINLEFKFESRFLCDRQCDPWGNFFLWASFLHLFEWEWDSYLHNRYKSQVQRKALITIDLFKVTLGYPGLAHDEEVGWIVRRGDFQIIGWGMPSIRQETRVLADSLLLACFKWTRCYFGDEKRHSFDTSRQGRGEKPVNGNIYLFSIRNRMQMSQWNVVNPVMSCLPAEVCRVKEKRCRGKWRQVCWAESSSQRRQPKVRPWSMTVVSDPWNWMFFNKEMGPSALNWPRHQEVFLWGQPCSHIMWCHG